MTTCISPLYNDNSEQINLQAMYDYYDSSKTKNCLYDQSDLEPSAEDREYLNEIEHEWEYELGIR